MTTCPSFCRTDKDGDRLTVRRLPVDDTPFEFEVSIDNGDEGPSCRPHAEAVRNIISALVTGSSYRTADPDGVALEISDGDLISVAGYGVYVDGPELAAFLTVNHPNFASPSALAKRYQEGYEAGRKDGSRSRTSPAVACRS